MARSIRFIIPFLILTVVALPALPLARAQSAVRTVAITHIQAVAAATGEVQVSALVSVLDEAGQPVLGLPANAFSISENNLPIDNQLITVTPRAADPLNVAVLIDTSSGMAKPGPNRVRAIDAAKDAAIAFIGQLGPDDQVAVYEFNSRAISQQDFTYDHNLAIDQGVVKLDARDVADACLNDALSQVLDRLATKNEGPRAIIAITGNPAGEACPVTPVESVVEAATTVGNAIPLFMVGFGSKLNQEELSRLGQGSGGRALLAPDSSQITEQLASVSQQLKNQYKLTYATKAAPGPATIIVFETASQLSDRRQVVIPAAILPTPTPVPHYAISLTVDQPSGDKLNVKVNATTGITLTQTELYVDDQSVKKATTPPLDQFTLDVNQLGSGKHIIRVDAIDSNQITATAQVELMLTIPPTPTPAPTPVPPPPAVTPPVSAGGLAASSVLPLALICGGGLLLLALAGLMGYLLLARSKPKQPAAPPPPPATTARAAPPQMPPVSVTSPPTLVAGEDDEDAAERTLLQPASAVAVTVPRAAKLIVIAGQELVSPPEFMLTHAETKIGRNTAKEPGNDIAVQDKEVSRAHARITRRNQQYFIQDLNSTMGTQINGIKLQPSQETALKHNDEITVGPRAKFRFEWAASAAEGETLLDMNMDELRTKYGAQDPFRTQYD